MPQSLQELTPQSARIGEWLLAVADAPKEQEYTYNWNGKPGTGKLFTCQFVSEDSTLYCIGKFKRKGREPEATQRFSAAKEKFKKGTTWKVRKVALTNDRPLYLGSSVKQVIDLNMTTV